ncbi:hypothetical protein EZV62_018626 [Acer yangbiense]|uniref:Uncharacterized protein n=1 Tax=Acer yangbiense TaxID=1000413 RepID=A0A5C7HJX2_9ROSI|nr:hypothetical protein EZV62_018626 [Acer yangbiense]
MRAIAPDQSCSLTPKSENKGLSSKKGVRDDLDSLVDEGFDNGDSHLFNKAGVWSSKGLGCSEMRNSRKKMIDAADYSNSGKGSCSEPNNGKEVLGGFDLVSFNLEDYSSNIEGVEVQVDPLQTSIEEAPSNLGNKKTRKWKLAAKTGDHTQITGITTSLSNGMIIAGQLANENSKKNYPSLIQRSPKNGGVDIWSPRSGLKGRDFSQGSQIMMEDKALGDRNSKFLHAQATARKRKIFITKIMDDGGQVHDSEDGIARVICE